MLLSGTHAKVCPVEEPLDLLIEEDSQGHVYNVKVKVEVMACLSTGHYWNLQNTWRGKPTSKVFDRVLLVP